MSSPYETWTEIPRPRGAAYDAVAALSVGSRWPDLMDVKPELVDALAECRVVVVGAGGIGLPTIEGLARLRLRSIWIVDPAATKLESTLTHPIDARDVGQSKATLAGERARAISPATHIAIHAGPVQTLPAHALVGCDVVILATDNLAAEVAVAQQALSLGIPLIQASVHGGTLTAQLRCVGSAEDSACLVCGYSRAEFESLDRGTRFSCAGADASPETPEPSEIPTTSFPALCGAAAQLALVELLRRTYGLDDDAAARDELIEYRGYVQQIVRTPLRRRGDCVLDHERWKVCTTEEPVESCSVRDLLRIAGLPDGELGQISLSVEGHHFIAFAFCGCVDHPRIDRFVPDGEAPGPCTQCGAERLDHPLYHYERIPGAVLADVIGVPLAQLGAPHTPCVVMRGKPGTTLVRGPLRPLQPSALGRGAPKAEDTARARPE